MITHIFGTLEKTSLNKLLNLMEFLKANSAICLFLEQFPSPLHNSCLLALSLLGLSVAKLRKSDFENLLEKILKSSKIEDLEMPKKLKIPLIPNIPKPQKLENSIKSEKKLIQETLPSTSESLPSNSSFQSISMKTSPKSLNLKLDLNKEVQIKAKSRCQSGSNTCRSVIDLADGFFDCEIIKEIYQKEMVADRMKIPFRKKWEMACKEVSSSNR
jgi:hypothetical protein